MNSCILMAEIVQDPQLRYTSESQTQIAEMLVQFPGSRPEDPPSTLKVVGWGNLAQEIHDNYHQGDRVIIEGRLTMNTVERKPEGFKEKRAELTAQKIYILGGGKIESFATTNVSPANAATVPTTAPSTAPNNVVPLGARNRVTNTVSTTANRPSSAQDWESNPAPHKSSTHSPMEAMSEDEDPDYDPIPF